MIEWFKHDVYCLQDDKLFALVSRYGTDGYAVFFHTLEAMYINNGEPLSDIAIRRIAFDLGLDYGKVQAILDFASSEECAFLFVNNGSGYISARVLEGVKEQEEKRLHYSNMGKVSAERRNSLKSNVGSTEVEHKSNVGSTDKIREDKTRRDNNNKSLSKDSLFGEKHSISPQTKSDLFGEKVEMEQESVPYKTIAEYWNKSVKGNLSQIRELTESRKALIKERWYEYHNEIYTAIDKVSASDFLTQWKACGFDWCFKKSNMVKILEGNYDNKDVSAPKRKDYSDIKAEDLDMKNFDWIEGVK